MSQKTVFDFWLEYVKKEKMCILATILQTEIHSSNNEAIRMFISAEALQIGDLGDQVINAQVFELASKKFMHKKPQSETITLTSSKGEAISVFLDINLPPIELIIFGAGHDAIPVAKYSVSMGLKTIIVDSRSHYNSEERFPGTTRIIAQEDEIEQQVEVGSRSFIIVMNHHMERDQITLEFALKSCARYVGLLGPRKRKDKILDEMASNGISFTGSQLKRLYSPIGLDIGADSPEEIALSILTEIIAVRNGHTGGFLQGSDIIHQVSV